MTKWQMLRKIFKNNPFSLNFIFCRFLLLPKHPFILRLS